MRYAHPSVEGRFLAGDPDAVCIVVRWVAQVLTLPRFRLLRDDWVDLEQEILRRVVESLRGERFDPSLEFRTYVQGIARNTAREEVHRRIRPLASRFGSPPESSVSADLDVLLHAHHVAHRLLESMPADSRRLLVWYYLEQKSFVEIAAALGTPVGTVKSRLSRCLRRARAQLMGEPTGRDNADAKAGD